MIVTYKSLIISDYRESIHFKHIRAQIQVKEKKLSKIEKTLVCEIQYLSNYKIN